MDYDIILTALNFWARIDCFADFCLIYHAKPYLNLADIFPYLTFFSIANKTQFDLAHLHFYDKTHFEDTQLFYFKLTFFSYHPFVSLVLIYIDFFFKFTFFLTNIANFNFFWLIIIYSSEYETI